MDIRDTRKCNRLNLGALARYLEVPADTLRPTQLVRRQGQCIDTEFAEIDGDAAGRLNGVRVNDRIGTG